MRRAAQNIWHEETGVVPRRFSISLLGNIHESSGYDLHELVVIGLII